MLREQHFGHPASFRALWSCVDRSGVLAGDLDRTASASLRGCRLIGFQWLPYPLEQDGPYVLHDLLPRIAHGHPRVAAGTQQAAAPGDGDWLCRPHAGWPFYALFFLDSIGDANGLGP